MGIDRNGRVAVVVLPHCGVGMEAAFDFDTTRVHLLSQSGITAARSRRQSDSGPLSLRIKELPPRQTAAAAVSPAEAGGG